MSKPLEVTYDVAEVDGLTEANEIFGSLRGKLAYNHPAWQKLYHASNYIQQRQKEVLASALADPEADTEPPDPTEVEGVDYLNNWA